MKTYEIIPQWICTKPNTNMNILLAQSYMVYLYMYGAFCA